MPTMAAVPRPEAIAMISKSRENSGLRFRMRTVLAELRFEHTTCAVGAGPNRASAAIRAHLLCARAAIKSTNNKTGRLYSAQITIIVRTRVAIVACVRDIDMNAALGGI